MKPARFAYHDPLSLQDALALFAEYGEAAKALAGGQSLVPLMNMRLARPEHLVDLNRLSDLAYIKEENGWLRLGAMTRQRAVEQSPLIAKHWPLLSRAIRYIGHVQIRNRGTLGGSIAHADPSAELPAVMVALKAQLVLQSKSGQRTVEAEAFFVTYLTTCLEPSELLVEVRVPAQLAGSRPAFQEVSRRHGDFALAGAAGSIALNDAGVCEAVRLALFGVAACPYRARAAEDLLIGKIPTETLIKEAALLAAADLEPESDIHASAEYRQEVGAVMVKRALFEACGITPTPEPIVYRPRWSNQAGST